jgi:hypothetical protein
MRESIVVVQSFKVNKDGSTETGKTYWFDDEAEAHEYLERAGQLSFEEGTYWSDPCEHRWDCVVVERVFKGEGSINEVISWWVARYEGGRLEKIVRTWTPPIETEYSFNFTGIGA